MGLVEGASRDRRRRASARCQVANSARGAVRLVADVVRTARAAGARGLMIMRGDSGRTAAGGRAAWRLPRSAEAGHAPRYLDQHLSAVLGGRRHREPAARASPGQLDRCRTGRRHSSSVFVHLGPLSVVFWTTDPEAPVPVSHVRLEIMSRSRFPRFMTIRPTAEQATSVPDTRHPASSDPDFAAGFDVGLIP
jgi:hypothetical protein